MTWLLSIHLMATGLMAGLIWFVQIVHYPLFQSVPEKAFRTYHRQHVQNTGRLVGPLMLVEAASGVGLLVYGNLANVVWAWAGIGLLGIIWISTWWLQVPCHKRLAKGQDFQALGRLIKTNWIRTLAWSGRLVLAMAMVAASDGPKRGLGEFL